MSAILHDEHTESALLGCALVFNQALDDMVEVLEPSHFGRAHHAAIYRAMLTLHRAGKPVDPLSLIAEVEAQGDGKVVSKAEVYGLETGAVRLSNVPAHCERVRDAALLRELRQHARDLIAEVEAEGARASAVLEDASSRLFALSHQATRSDWISGSELASRVYEAVEQLGSGQKVSGLPTGFAELDNMTRGMQRGDLILVGARPSMGKALALDTPIPTPSGWTMMGDLSVGDQVFDEQGRPCSVTYVTEVQRDRVCYEVVFSDGSAIVADADHRWFAYDHAAWKSARERRYRSDGGYSFKANRNKALARSQEGRWKEPRVVTTQQMLDEGLVVSSDAGRCNWRIPVAKPLDLPVFEAPVDPYVLGCWLGDGDTAGARMTVGDKDADHFIREFEGAGYRLAKTAERYAYSTAPVPGTGKWQAYRGQRRHLAKELVSLGLLRGQRKHIPQSYLRASADQRLALLQGLMDTDGSMARGTNVAEIALADESLLRQVRELVCSLGQRPSSIKRKRIVLKDGRTATAFRFHWTPTVIVFRLARKVERQRLTKTHHRFFDRLGHRSIVAIRPVSSVPVRCITVNSESHLYLAGESMIPTHNTAFALQVALHAAKSVPVAFFSVEMAADPIGMRAVINAAQVDGFRLMSGWTMSQVDYQRIAEGTSTLANASLFIDESPQLSPVKMRSKLRRLRAKTGTLGLVVVDYLQLLEPMPEHKRENKTNQVAGISRALKVLAREMSVPFVVLSQLNRGTEHKAEKRPSMSDLRDSGALEQDADVVLLLHRPNYYDANQPADLAEVVVAKQRNGPTGIVNLSWVASHMRFGDGTGRVA